MKVAGADYIQRKGGAKALGPWRHVTIRRCSVQTVQTVTLLEVTV